MIPSCLIEVILGFVWTHPRKEDRKTPTIRIITRLTATWYETVILFNLEFDDKMVHSLPNPFPRSIVSQFDLAGPGLSRP